MTNKIFTENFRKRILVISCYVIFPLFALLQIETWPMTGFPMYARGMKLTDLSDYEAIVTFTDGTQSETLILPQILTRLQMYDLIDCEKRNSAHCGLLLIESLIKKLGSEKIKNISLKKYRFIRINGQWERRLERTYEK